MVNRLISPSRTLGTGTTIFGSDPPYLYIHLRRRMTYSLTIYVVLLDAQSPDAPGAQTP